MLIMLFYKNKAWFVLITIVLAFLANTLSGNSALWKNLAYRDLKAAHNYLLNDSAGGVDKKNPHFTNWLDLGYERARLLVQQVDSPSSYNLTLNYYLNGFADQHVEYVPYLRRFDFKRLWPGFTVYYFHKQFYVSGLARDKGLTDIPPPGAQLRSCDGKKPVALLQKRVFPYFGDANLQASWFIVTPRLFFYYPNPWFKVLHYCKFFYQGKVTRYALKWQPITAKRTFNLRQLASYSYHGQLHVSRFTKNGIWLSLPTFMPETQQQEQQLRTIIATAKGWREKKIIVIDVRGNTGGNSFWGTELLNALYGKRYFQQQMQNLSAPVYQWRVSAGNINELSGFYLHYAKQNFSQQSAMVLWLETTIKGMRDALKAKQKYFPNKVKASSPVAKTTHFVNPVQGKVYLLTDGRCASACLTFADQLFHLANVKQIGQATNADSDYTELRLVHLPSGAHLYFPMKVQRYRKRGRNQPYIPQGKYYYNGDINNTHALQRWIKSTLY